MLRKNRLAIEKLLRARGLASPPMRRALSGQILLAEIAVAAGLICLCFSAWPLAFGLGAAAATVNVLLLALSIVRALGRPYTPAAAAAHFCFFLARFALTGGIVYVLLIWLHLPVLPLLAGLSTVAVASAFRGFRATGIFLKEA